MERLVNIRYWSPRRISPKFNQVCVEYTEDTELKRYNTTCVKNPTHLYVILLNGPTVGSVPIYV